MITTDYTDYKGQRYEAVPGGIVEAYAELYGRGWESNPNHRARMLMHVEYERGLRADQGDARVRALGSGIRGAADGGAAAKYCECDESGACACRRFVRGSLRGDTMDEDTEKAYREGVAAKGSLWKQPRPSARATVAAGQDTREDACEDPDQEYLRSVTRKANLWQTRAPRPNARAAHAQREDAGDDDLDPDAEYACMLARRANAWRNA